MIKWSEREWIIVRRLYDAVGPCPPQSEKNVVVSSIARLIGRSPNSVCMRLRNFGAQDQKARAKYGRKFLSGEWVPGDGKGCWNRFYFRMRIDHPAVFERKLKEACKPVHDGLFEWLKQACRIAA